MVNTAQFRAYFIGVGCKENRSIADSQCSLFLRLAIELRHAKGFNLVFELHLTLLFSMLALSSDFSLFLLVGLYFGFGFVCVGYDYSIVIIQWIAIIPWHEAKRRVG